MRRKIIGAAILLIFCCGTVKADDAQMLTINGERVEKTVSSFTFDGDNVVIQFGETVESYPLGSVILEFQETTGIENISVFNLDRFAEDSLDISGLTNGTKLSVFDVNGKNVINCCADHSSANIDISRLTPGVYILKADRNIIKFVKK